MGLRYIAFVFRLPTPAFTDIRLVSELFPVSYFPLSLMGCFKNSTSYGALGTTALSRGFQASPTLRFTCQRTTR